MEYGSLWASQLAQLVKNTLVNVGDLKAVGSSPGWGRSPEGGNGCPLQYSCLENPMDRGAWQVTVRGVAKSQTQLGQLRMRMCMVAPCFVENYLVK